MKCITAIGSAALTLAFTSAAQASMSQATITPPGGFMQAGAYDITGGAHIPGGDLATGYGTGQDFHEQSFTGLSSAQASASFSNGTISNTASGTAELGRVRTSAT